MTDRVRRLCSEDTVDKYLMQWQKQDEVSLAAKKSVYISLPFGVDTQAQNYLSTVINYDAQNILCNGPTHLLYIFFLLYKFTSKIKFWFCSFLLCIFIHMLLWTMLHWLSSGITKSIKSSVLTDLVATVHTIDIEQSFQPIYRVQGNQSKMIRHRILAPAEAMGIRLFNPPLCAQKQFVQTLKLPWPSISSTSPPLIT